MQTTFRKIEKTIKRWYLMLLVGIVFVILGIWTIATPLSSYTALSIVFALGFLVNGIAEVIFAFGNRHQNWGWTLVLGILNIVVEFFYCLILPYQWLPCPYM